MRTRVAGACLLLMAGCLPITAEPGHVPPAPAPLAAGTGTSDSAGTGDSTVASGAAPLVLKPGDVVRVAVWRNQELSGDFVVGVNGALRHPLYQEVPVAGVPIPVVEQRLKEFLAKFQTDPAVVVEPLFNVVVGGEVRDPKVYELPRETTIAMAIAGAGGPTADARMDRVRLWRGEQEYVLDLTRADSPWANGAIRSGDRITIDRRSSVFQNLVVPIVTMVGALAGLINLARR